MSETGRRSAATTRDGRNGARDRSKGHLDRAEGGWLVGNGDDSDFFPVSLWASCGYGYGGDSGRPSQSASGTGSGNFDDHGAVETHTYLGNGKRSVNRCPIAVSLSYLRGSPFARSSKGIPRSPCSSLNRNNLFVQEDQGAED